MWSSIIEIMRRSPCKHSARYKDFASHSLGVNDIKVPFQAASGQPVTAVIDFTWGGWTAVEEKSETNGFPYLRLDTTNHHFVKVLFKSA